MSVSRSLPVALVALLVLSALPMTHPAQAVPVGPQGVENTASTWKYKWVDSTTPSCRAPNVIGAGIPTPHTPQDPAKGCPLGWDEIAGQPFSCTLDIGESGPSSQDRRSALSAGACSFILPINFFYYGTSYAATQIYAQENGMLQFNSAAATCCGLASRTPKQMPTNSGVTNLIAPFWTNLHGWGASVDTTPKISLDECWDVPSGPTTNFAHVWVTKFVQGTYPNRYIVVEWDRMVVNDADQACIPSIEGANHYATFEVKLYLDTGNVDVVYKEAHPNGQAVSVGMESLGGTFGMNYCSPTVLGQCDASSATALIDRGIRFYRSNILPLNGAVTINEDCVLNTVQAGANNCSALTPDNFAYDPDFGEADHPAGVQFCMQSIPAPHGTFSGIPNCTSTSVGPLTYTPWPNWNGDASLSPGPGMTQYAYRTKDPDTGQLTPLLSTCTVTPNIGCVSITINAVDDPPVPKINPQGPFPVVSGDAVYVLPTPSAPSPTGIIFGATDPEIRNGGVTGTVHSRNSWWCAAPGPNGCGVPNIASHRELGQMRTVYDGQLQGGNTLLSSLTANFNAYDVGVNINGVGIPVGATIASVVSRTQVLLSSAATQDFPDGDVLTIERPILSAWVGPECPGYTPAWLPQHGQLLASDRFTGADITGVNMDGGFLYKADVYTGTDTFRYCLFDGEKYSLTSGTVTMQLKAPIAGWTAHADEYPLTEGASSLVALGPTAPAANDDGSLCPGGLEFRVADPLLGPPHAYAFTWDDPTSRFSYVAQTESAGDDAFTYRMVCTSLIRTVPDGFTSGTTVTSATANFGPIDVGASIVGAGIPAGATIVSVGSSTSVTISAAAASGGPTSITITPQSNAASVRLRVAPVNDQPFLDDWMSYGDTIFEDNGFSGSINPPTTPPTFTRTVPKIILGVSAGQGWEEPQTQQMRVVIVSQSNPGLFTSIVPCPANYAWPMTAASCPAPVTGPALTLLGPTGAQTASLSYTTKPDAFGFDTVCWRIMDNGGTSGGGQDTYPAPDQPPLCFDITVKPAGDRPRPVPDSYTIYRNMPLVAPSPSQLWPVPLPGVQDLLLKGTPDLEVDGEALSTYLWSGPTNGGTLAYLNPDGSFKYVPPANVPATSVSPPFVDTFQYWDKDTNLDGSGPTLVTITVLFNAQPSATITTFTWPDTTKPNPHVGDIITATGSCTDADNEPLVLLWDFGDGFLSTDNPTTHPYNAPGDYQVSLRCFDPKGAAGIASRSVTVEADSVSGGYTGTDPGTGPGAPVLPPPDLTVNAGLDLPVPEKTRTELHGTASEADVDSWQWTQTAGPAVTIVDANKADAWFNSPSLAGGPAVTLSFSLVAAKGARTSAPDAVDLTVTPLNTAPVSRPSAPATAHEGDTIDLVGSASSDADAGDQLTYRWIATPYDDGLADASKADTTFTVPDGTLGRSLTFTLEVNDGTALGLDSVQVAIVPKTYTGDGFSAQPGDGGTVTFTPVAPGARFVWDFGDGSQDTSSGPTTHTYTATGQYTVWMTAQDADGQELAFHQSVPILLGEQSDATHGVETVAGSGLQERHGTSSLAWWVAGIGILLAIALVVTVLVLLQRRR